MVELCRNDKDGATHIVLDLWNNAHQARNVKQPMAKAMFRMRLAKSRKLRLVPIPWYEWHVLKTPDARIGYLSEKLRMAGLAVH